MILIPRSQGIVSMHFGLSWNKFHDPGEPGQCFNNKRRGMSTATTKNWSSTKIPLLLRGNTCEEIILKEGKRRSIKKIAVKQAYNNVCLDLEIQIIPPGIRLEIRLLPRNPTSIYPCSHEPELLVTSLWGCHISLVIFLWVLKMWKDFLICSGKPLPYSAVALLEKSWRTSHIGWCEWYELHASEETSEVDIKSIAAIFWCHRGSVRKVSEREKWEDCFLKRTAHPTVTLHLSKFMSDCGCMWKRGSTGQNVFPSTQQIWEPLWICENCE